MKKCLVISIRFLGDRYHGRTENGREPEWPPSPLRLFQAIVAGVAPRWVDLQLREREVPALEWLQGLGAPRITGPLSQPGRPVLNYVRENLSDVVPDKRDAKIARPTLFLGDPVVRYSWWFEASKQLHAETIAHCSRHCHSLGWGVDMIVGNGEITETEPEAGAGEVWYPQPNPTEGTSMLRVPCCSTSETSPGTLAELRDRFRHSLNRIADGRNPVPPLTAFAIVGYRRPTDTASRPFVAFELRTPDFERFRPFNPTRHACAVAGMVRNALADLARDMRPFGLATDKDLNRFINTFIHGHTPEGERPAHGPEADCRFAYLPLPSLEHRGGAGVVVTAIRRVLVVGPPGDGREVAWARVLSGRELSPLNKHTPPAALRIIEKPAAALRNDPNLRSYVGAGIVWSTVTPLVLPGHDEAAPEIIARRVRLAPDQAAQQRVREKAVERTERLLRLAFEQAGWSRELVAEAKLEWQSVGFRAGVELVDRYCVPNPLNRLPLYHVRVRWPVPVRGPLSVGAGRYRGIGVFAADKIE